MRVVRGGGGAESCCVHHERDHAEPDVDCCTTACATNRVELDCHSQLVNLLYRGYICSLVPRIIMAVEVGAYQKINIDIC